MDYKIIKIKKRCYVNSIKRAGIPGESLSCPGDISEEDTHILLGLKYADIIKEHITPKPPPHGMTYETIKDEILKITKST